MNQQLPYKNNKIRINQKAVYVQIRFGNPTAGDCRNFGICKMEVYEGTVDEFEVRQGYALSKITFEEKQVQLLFFKSSMTIHTKQQHFEKRMFLVEVENKNNVIAWKKGRYPVSENSLGYIIYHKILAYEQIKKYN